MSLTLTNYKGNILFHPVPYWRNVPVGEYERSISMFGQTYGYSYAESEQLHTRYRGMFTYKFAGRQDIFTVDNFFDSMRGRWGNVWFPSWTNDFTLRTDISFNSTEVNVRTTEDYGTDYPSTGGHGRHLFIWVNNSIYFARKIVGYDSDTVYIDTVLGQTLKRESVKFLSFLYMGRLSIDEIEWNYQGPDLAMCTLSFIELPFEYSTTTTTTA